MKRLFVVFGLFLSTNAFAQNISQPNCPAQIIHWDSDGHSPWLDHAECAGPINAAPSGSSQIVEASTDFAGGVGYATFTCKDGSWIIDIYFNSQESGKSTGNCAD